MKRHVLWTVLGVVLLCSMAAQGRAQIGFNGIGARAGIVKPENIDLTFGFGGHTDLGMLVPMLRLYPSVEFWSSNHVNEFSINGDVRYYFPMTGGGFSPFVGGGVCIVFWSLDTALGDASDTELGFEFLGGIEIPVTFGTAFVEGKYKVDGADVLKISGGVTFPIGG